MDLIYMNASREDIGILSGYTLDLAFGSDENDFELQMNLSDHVCEEGYYIYIENTEYGGIIDSISVDTENEVVTYSGRTWHGILQGKVICPDSGQDYLVLDGEANEVIASLITRLDLDGLFEASEEDSEISIDAYQMNRYVGGYEGIRKMLQEFDGKLKFNFKNGKCVLWAEPYIDYSQDEEFDKSQVAFSITKNYRPVNHLICLGQGDLKDRTVIHLFTDENGGIQPYSTSEVPLQDSDYITDTSNQLLFDEYEVADVYDYSNASITENYKLLEAKPSDWNTNCESYYEYNTESEEYSNVESYEEDVYTLQKIKPYDWSVNCEAYYEKSGSEYVSVETTTSYSVTTSQPSDWSKNYANYYTKSGSEYSNVEAVESIQYVKQTQKPSDWTKNYGNYYEYWSDGTYWEYRKVSGITKYKYVPQTMVPSDWTKNFANYYVKKKNGGYKAVEGTGKKKNKAPTWKAKRYYTKEPYSVAPAWKSNYYYTYKCTASAPTWATSTYYIKSEDTAPTWATNTYYSMSTETMIPEWTSGNYFEKVIDNYAELVAGGIEKLQESYDCDSISIDFNSDEVYDIGDVVGATEVTTGIAVWQPITKKIVTIKDEISIEYKVGE